MTDLRKINLSFRVLRCVIFKVRVPAVPENDTGFKKRDFALRRSAPLSSSCDDFFFQQFRFRFLADRPWFELRPFRLRLLPRKEVIQPHLPIRLPCYDFTPVIGLTFDG